MGEPTSRMDGFREVEDEGTDELEEGSSMSTSEDEDAQEEGDEEEDVVAEVARQVAMLGTSCSSISVISEPLMQHIFSLIEDLPDLLSATLVCGQWERIIRSSDAIWRPIYSSIPQPITTYLPTANHFERVLHHGKRLEIRRGTFFLCLELFNST